jgi:hypothetical protein
MVQSEFADGQVHIERALAYTFGHSCTKTDIFIVNWLVGWVYFDTNIYF